MNNAQEDPCDWPCVDHGYARDDVGCSSHFPAEE
jgi:hypothetical protein